MIDVPAPDLTVAQLHEIYRLRVDVFVVEQACPYREVDGRDLEPTTRHVWIAAGDDPVAMAAYLRVLDDGEHRRIGRVATSAGARGHGLARQLVEHVLASTAGPWVLDAQTYLVEWYERLGFATDGPEFVEDGIAHQTMRRT